MEFSCDAYEYHRAPMKIEKIRDMKPGFHMIIFLDAVCPFALGQTGKRPIYFRLPSLTRLPSLAST